MWTGDEAVYLEPPCWGRPFNGSESRSLVVLIVLVVRDLVIIPQARYWQRGQ